MDKKDFIIATLNELLGHLKITTTGISAEPDPQTGSLCFVIATPDSAILIGEHGARLMALNHLVKRMVEKKFPDEKSSFLIDVNDYQKKRMNDIRAKAHMLAERARYFKSSVEMDPMSSYERMIVHAEFSGTSDIATESTGQGKDRRVIIRYTEEKAVATN